MPYVSSMGVLFTIYQTVIKKSEEKRAKDVESANYLTEQKFNRIEGDLKKVQDEFEKQKNAFVEMRVHVTRLTTETEAQGKSFQEASQRLEKSIERHEKKLDAFGKVTIK